MPILLGASPADRKRSHRVSREFRPAVAFSTVDGKGRGWFSAPKSIKYLASTRRSCSVTATRTGRHYGGLFSPMIAWSHLLDVKTYAKQTGMLKDGVNDQIDLALLIHESHNLRKLCTHTF